MAFEQYPDNIATTIYVDEEIQLSDIIYTEKTQLQYLGLQLFKYGFNTGVNLYINAYTTSDVLIATSERIKIDQFPSETDYFYGWVYFKFDKRVNLSGNAVRFKLFLENYTFSEASWIGAVYDWPTTMGYNDYSDQITSSPFALDVIGAS
jgi:hypothetical protein